MPSVTYFITNSKFDNISLNVNNDEYLLDSAL